MDPQIAPTNTNTGLAGGDRKATILIVEDSPVQAELLRRELEGAGYAIIVASNGAEGLGKAKANRPAAVVSDINMPLMDGYAMCQAIRREESLKDMPVILVTMLSDPEDVIRGLTAGADAYLTKPYNIPSLVSRIESLRAHPPVSPPGEEPRRIEVWLADETYLVDAHGPRMLNLLVSTYENAVLQNRELEATQRAFSELNENLERKVQEQTVEIRESEEKFHSIADSAPDAIVIADANGGIFFSNAATERIFGYSREELIGGTVEMLVPEPLRDRHATHRHDYQRAPIARIMGGALQLEGRRKDGSHFPIEVSLSPLLAGGSRYVISMVRDVTERRLLEQQLHQSQKLESIGQLSGGLAHDFNNLLGVILGNLDLLERALGDNESALKRVRTAQRAATRGAELTQRLLAFSRRQELSPQPTAVNTLIGELLELLPRTLGPDIRIVTRLGADLPATRVDAAGLESVLLNLAINSRDAMPEGGTLEFRTETVTLDESYVPVKAGEIKSGNYIRISVTDTGEGMSRETLERVFEPFFTTKERGKGTGLGLAMVHGFVKQSGGNIRVYSELGHGTTMNIYLPLASGEAVVAQAAPARHIRVEGCGTVLVVDDEVDLLEVAIAYLEQTGYRVLHATDAAGAIEVFEREPGIDLLLTDVIMPGGMNGVRLAQELKRRKPAIKVVYSSGFPSSALAERSQSKVDGVLVNKPYRREALVEAVARAMAGEPRDDLPHDDGDA